MHDQRFLDYSRQVGNGVREFNAVIALIVGKECLAATKAGDGSTAIDPAMFARAWEACGPFRDHMIMCLARATRDEWRRDVASIMENVDASMQTHAIASSIDIRFRCVLDFAFRYLAARHVCLLADCLVMCFEADMTSSEAVRELSASAGKSSRGTTDLLQALVLGGSGMYRYQPEKLIHLGVS